MSNTPLYAPIGHSYPIIPQHMKHPHTIRWLVLGLLTGFIPASLAALLITVQLQNLLFSLPSGVGAIGWLVISGLYGSGWIGGLLLSVVHSQPSSKTFARGLMIGLATSLVLIPCAFVANLLLWFVVLAAECGSPC